MNLNPSTLGAVIGDLVDSLVRHGIRKIVLLNSHGGNDLKPVLRELYGRTPAKLFLCNWYRIFNDVYRDIFEEPDDHAGEMETSLALAYFPDLVGRHAGRQPDGRRGQQGGHAVRGRQPRLGLDHPALAPADDQRRGRQSARRHRREGPPPDGPARRAAGRVPGRAVGGRSGRAVSVLRKGTHARCFVGVAVALPPLDSPLSCGVAVQLPPQRKNCRPNEKPRAPSPSPSPTPPG